MAMSLGKKNKNKYTYVTNYNSTVLGPIYAGSRDPFTKLWTKCKKTPTNKTNKEAWVYFLTATGDEETEVIIAIKSSKSKHKKKEKKKKEEEMTIKVLRHVIAPLQYFMP